MFVPRRYEGSEALPLVVLLHGYTASGAIQESYFQFQPLAQERGFIYVHPDGTTDGVGQKFWNATDAVLNLVLGRRRRLGLFDRTHRARSEHV